jgi:hypothetical protein
MTIAKNTIYLWLDKDEEEAAPAISGSSTCPVVILCVGSFCGHELKGI